MSRLASTTMFTQVLHEASFAFAIQIQPIRLSLLTSMDSVSQNIILTSDAPRNIPIYRFSRRQAGDAARSLDASHTTPLGFSISHSADGAVESLALATPKQVYLIQLQSAKRSEMFPLEANFKRLLQGEYGMLIGFGMASMAVHLYYNLQYRIRGIDLSTLCSPSTNEPSRPSQLVVAKLHQWSNLAAVDQLWDESVEQGIKNICLRAWISASVGQHCFDKINTTLKVDTSFLRREELMCLGKLLKELYLLQQAEPSVRKSEVSGYKWNKDGDLCLLNSRYPTRVRRSGQTSVLMTNTDGREFIGRPIAARGKTTSVKFRGNAKLSGDLASVRVIGREEPTSSERARDEFILLVLRGERKLGASRFVRLLWFPTDTEYTQPRTLALPQQFNETLNDSQRSVVSAMVSTLLPLVIVQGPPGTGKTTTISAAVKLWTYYTCPVWIIAHSNVAVKNIAKSLFKKRVDFKILISQEFYVEWHEHLYLELQDHLLRSDELPDDTYALERAIGDSRIVLCTLSMLSNPALDIKGIFDLIPVERLVIDEASQINVFDLMHVFDKFSNLEKVCFFGDPEQLPPYGKDKASSLQCVFDLQQFRSRFHFLNIQYRMPTPLGSFISQEVYAGELLSQHKIVHTSCVRFVDVSKGCEQKGGRSWMNLQEVQTIVHLVRYYYRNQNFCVVTPYDAQRAEIAKQLKVEGLPWERVFNVDSFQGNEEDYVLVSVVRTKKAGFLQSQNRMNVMLSRCKLGMVIVTNRIFLRTGGQHTMLGRLSRYWDKQCGELKVWTDWRSIVNHEADMPGVPAPHKPTNIASIDVPFSQSFHHTDLADVDGHPGQTPARKDEDFPPLPGYSGSRIQGGWKAVASAAPRHGANRETGNEIGAITRHLETIRLNGIEPASEESLRQYRNNLFNHPLISAALRREFLYSRQYSSISASQLSESRLFVPIS